MAQEYPARVEVYSVPVRQSHPLAVMIASRLGQIFGRGINGHTGTIRYGYPSTFTQRTKYGGYVQAPQLFLGANITSGRARLPTPALSSSHVPLLASAGSPLANAMANVSAARGAFPGAPGDEDG